MQKRDKLEAFLRGTDAPRWIKTNPNLFYELLNGRKGYIVMARGNGKSEAKKAFERYLMEKPHLRIGVIGYSSDILRMLVMPCLASFEHDNGLICSRSSYTMLLNDGTEYCMIYRPEDTRGVHLDQLVIADDHRWLIYEKQGDLIAHAKEILRHSCVPEEYQIIELELF
jgi:hypothetical protein